jgi:hypothetical protein
MRSSGPGLVCSGCQELAHTAVGQLLWFALGVGGRVMPLLHRSGLGWEGRRCLRGCVEVLVRDRRVGGAGDGLRSRLGRRGRAVSRVGGSVLLGLAASLRRWRCGVERLAGKPGLSVSIVCTGHKNLQQGQLTRPSAQSIIASSGRSARYIAVVHHHIGKPIKSTIAQNAAIT